MPGSHSIMKRSRKKCFLKKNFEPGIFKKWPKVGQKSIFGKKKDSFEWPRVNALFGT